MVSVFECRPRSTHADLSASAHSPATDGRQPHSPCNRRPPCPDIIIPPPPASRLTPSPSPETLAAALAP
jgi:hypothetical protein